MLHEERLGCKPGTGLSPAAISSCFRASQEKQTAWDWLSRVKVGKLMPAHFVYFWWLHTKLCLSNKSLNGYSSAQIDIWVFPTPSKIQGAAIHGKMENEASDKLIVCFLGLAFSECLQKIRPYVQVAARGSLGRFSVMLSRYNQRLLLNPDTGISTEPLSNSHIMLIVGQQRGCVHFSGARDIK